MALGAPPTKNPLLNANGTITDQWAIWLSQLVSQVNNMPSATRSDSADVTMTATDSIVILDCTTGGKLVSLPPYSKIVKGQSFTIKKDPADATANTITITSPEGKTIDGAPNKILSAHGEAVTVSADGTNWVIIA
jgi:hypothetical protein